MNVEQLAELSNGITQDLDAGRLKTARNKAELLVAELYKATDKISTVEKIANRLAGISREDLTRAESRIEGIVAEHRANLIMGAEEYTPKGR